MSTPHFNYTEQLEVQNEELQQKLSEAQKELECIKETPVFQQMAEAVQADAEYAWSIHCNLAMTIKDTSRMSHKSANIVANSIMMHFYKVDMNNNIFYKQTMAG